MKLKDFPFACNFVSDEFLRSKGYRKRIIDNYVAFYLVDDAEKQVVIMGILYGRRKYEDIL
jgi:plasmid stabilization system protein ParE